jgi:hypothetical protein
MPAFFSSSARHCIYNKCGETVQFSEVEVGADKSCWTLLIIDHNLPLEIQ